MAAKEIYDHVSTTTADYDYTLAITAQGAVRESGYKNQVVHRADDNTREVVTLSSGSMFFVEWDWNLLTETESGTVFDLYHDTDKANGKANSFKWTGHDGHTYVVAFDCAFTREGTAVSRWGVPGLRLEIIGRIID